MGDPPIFYVCNYLNTISCFGPPLRFYKLIRYFPLSPFQAQGATIMIDSTVHPDMAKWLTEVSQKLGCKEPKTGHFRSAAVGDKCVQENCNQGALESTRGIEVGYFFSVSLLFRRLQTGLNLNLENCIYYSYISLPFPFSFPFSFFSFLMDFIR
jgi:hypothetical protein